MTLDSAKAPRTSVLPMTTRDSRGIAESTDICRGLMAHREGATGEEVHLPHLPVDTSLRDALALLVAEHRDELLVTDGDGAPLGVVKREDILR